MKKLTTLFIALIFLASCASTGGKKTVKTTQAKKGFLDGYYEKMEPEPKGGAKMREDVNKCWSFTAMVIEINTQERRSS